MANLFQEVLTDVKGVEERLLGPTYPYYKNIKTPTGIGMSDRGTIQQMAKNIEGLIEYVELLVTGDSKASTTGGPLGNKFFLKTGGKCIDKQTGTEQDRYIYINNVPVGNIPIVSQGLGVNFSEFKGLIPGTISNLNAFNPVTMFQSFLAGSKPDCQQITMETIDTYNMKSTETHFVTLTDIKNTDPCLFPNKINPATGSRCVETFSNIDETTNMNNFVSIKIPDDPFVQAYFASLGVVSIYVLYKIMLKNGMIPK